jgi:SAM-dependent methyltransferase
MIFDIGTGPNGSYWWNKIKKNTKIDGIDMYFFPKYKKKNVNIYKFDASNLSQLKNNLVLKKYFLRNIFINQKTNFLNKYDLVVANHVLEHVTNPENLIKGISLILKKDGFVYVGVPDGYNFTDVFYHLIHSDGGGHIQRHRKSQLLKLFRKYGFKLVSQQPWPDDWLWLEKCFDFKSRGIKYIDQKDISYLAKTFRKELTPKKGYNYGWELIFQKK